jgi:hypothetical protein
MNEMPTDLVALPTAPYSERPISLPLDVEECRTAIWIARGNITEAAKILKITPLRLRTFVGKSPYLSAEMQESLDQVVDIAERVVVDALEDTENPARQDTMARFVLGSQGKRRGWGSATNAGVNIKNSGNGTIVVQWADGSTFGDQDNKEGEAIDITPNESNVVDSDEGEAA